MSDMSYGSHARRIQWSGVMAPVTPRARTPVTSISPTTKEVKRIKRPRTGNGHVAGKKRAMTQEERERITHFFIAHSGKLEYDMSVTWRKENLPTDISAFQVVGFIATLHRAVASGRLTISDRAGYDAFMKAHRNYAARFKTTTLPNLVPVFTVAANKESLARPKRYVSPKL